ncbi:hypothetical protein EJ08DRAFT_649814 [Tothia fuscella]|uniref:Pyruvate dehydrogenase protein x component n=1 Tax=Tothia fuscella TaxID=1048955 RepID=A0A9P4NRS4_9PEZI|nr:hypothetical protein EJ08DRAFT_649814 [Tothia fuscella]
MASIASTCKSTARACARQLRNSSASQTRNFRTVAAANGAHNFTMPALSPTMTEGNISGWKVKEGDSFSAGDVLLEVETDKAQMDVEAQDDGKMAKIMSGDGSKAVAVGTRIAVLADPEDDLSTLEIPTEESPKKEEKSESESKSSPPPKDSSESSSSPPPPKSLESSSKKAEKKPSSSSDKPQKQKYPLYPSVAMLVHTHNINPSEITPTGPNGRLLKGDVLAYIDAIPSSYPAEASSRISKLTHLDLSNVKPAPPKTDTKSKQEKPVEKEEVDVPVKLAVPVSLTAVLQVQKRMQESLGITLPLSTFIARAIALANEDLPLGKTTPTQNDLFNSILGLDKVNKKATRDGSYSPSIVALPTSNSLSVAPKSKKSSSGDIFDELLGGKKKSVPITRRVGAKGVASAENVFSLEVGKGEEKRGKVFLERVKSVLEVEPGRLVL